jgi:phosphate transport system substrate-binding protein
MRSSRQSLVNFCFALASLWGLTTMVQAAPDLEIRAGGTGGGTGAMRVLAQEYARIAPNVNVSIAPSLGSSGGIQALRAGALDLALTGRPLGEAEKGTSFKTFALGRTPAMFGVQATDSLVELSSAKLIDWLSSASPVSANGTRVRIVLRPPEDIDTKLVRALGTDVSDAMTTAQNRPGMIVAATDKDAADAIERTAGAFGLTTLGQVLTEQRKIKGIKLNGVEPTPANAANGTYPLVKTLYVSYKEPLAPHVKGFIEFLSSAAARTLLVQYGYYSADTK